MCRFIYIAVFLAAPWVLMPGAHGEPMVTASINESTAANLCRGWPVLLDAGLFHPDPTSTDSAPVLIDMGNRPWSDAVSIEVRNAGGQVQSWAWQLFNVTSNSLVLDATNAAQLLYFIAPSNTLAIAAGVYTIDILLTITNATTADAWIGTVESVPVELTLRNEPSSLTAEELETRQQQFASFHFIQDELQQADAAVVQLLSAQPGNILGLSLKSYILHASGDFSAAQAVLTEAIDRIYANSPAEPPADLVHRRNDLRREAWPVKMHSPVLGGSTLSLIWDSNPGDTYTLETSTDLADWQTAATNLHSTATLFLWRTNAPSAKTFFRVRH